MCTCKICEKCHKDAQLCTCYSEDIAQIHSQVDDVTRVIQHDAEDIQDDVDDIQHNADDKKEIENAKQQDESGKSREENDRSNVELTNEEIESEEEGNNNQVISCRSVTDSGDDRMVVEDFVKITNNTNNCDKNCTDIDEFKVAQRRRRRFNPVPSMKSSMRRTPIAK
ncbi:hypothetical protein ACJMK2_034512 [Sinanodonta woodiana]|uniref:Uncharacterized protein n=1 Tax=Sinanodonta woodiana TaxID=1069815 RepID=A0ABD3WRU6_SINWO